VLRCVAQQQEVSIFSHRKGSKQSMWEGGQKLSRKSSLQTIVQVGMAAPVLVAEVMGSDAKATVSKEYGGSATDPAAAKATPVYSAIGQVHPPPHWPPPHPPLFLSPLPLNPPLSLSTFPPRQFDVHRQ